MIGVQRNGVAWLAQWPESTGAGWQVSVGCHILHLLHVSLVVIVLFFKWQELHLVMVLVGVLRGVLQQHRVPYSNDKFQHTERLYL